MANRLPVPGSDNGTWGTILNSYLSVSLNADGTLNPTAVKNAGGGGSGGGSNPTTGLNALTGFFHADAYSGIDRGGNSDSTTGISNFLRGLPAGATAYFPPGIYKITSTLAVPAKGCRILGAGSGAGSGSNTSKTTFSFQPGSNNDIMMDSPAYTNFEKIQFLFPTSSSQAQATATFFNMNGTFCCKWIDCVFQGQHNNPNDIFGNGSTVACAINFNNNAGDSTVRDCFFLNMGRAIITQSIQNGIQGGKFGYTYIGIDCPGGNGGMDITGYTVFVTGGGHIGTAYGHTPAHIRITSSGAGQWNMNGVWMEGGDVGINCTGNPSQFTLTGSKISAYTTCIRLHGGSNPTLIGVQTGQGGQSYDVTVAGYYAGLTSNQSGDGQFSGGRVRAATFPSGSVVEGVPR